jgi:ribose 1,5-bisphosphokinase
VTRRYAIYFTPSHDSSLARFGSAWLAGGEAPPGVSAELFESLTREPRRYGFHATLKAPFRLAAGHSPDELLAAVREICARRAAFELPPLRVAWLDGFLALVTERNEPCLDSLAATCVARLDALRAPLSHAERERHLAAPLSASQRELLERWGYPYVLDAWRFHMTLTGKLVPRHESLRAALAASAWSALPRQRVLFDAISVLVELAPGQPFELVERLPLHGRARLVYLVGPSGAGKDSLLAWLRSRLSPKLPVRIARRTVARMRSEPAPGDAENAELVSRARFDALRESGAFALDWDANGCSYGIRRENLSELADGCSVVVNGSRAYLGEALRRFPGLEVISVTAPRECLRERLVARGRESSEAVEARVARNPEFALPAGVPVVEIANDGVLERAGRRLLREILIPHPAFHTASR